MLVFICNFYHYGGSIFSSWYAVRIFEDMSYKAVTSTPHAISYEEKGIYTHNVIKEGKAKQLIKNTDLKKRE